MTRVQNCLVSHDRHLRFVVAKWFHSEQKLVEDDSHTPYINLLRDLWVLALVEAFGSLVPVGADALARQFYLVLILFDYFAQSEVSDLDLAIMEYDVLRLEIVMDDFLLLISEVFEAG